MAQKQRTCLTCRRSLFSPWQVEVVSVRKHSSTEVMPTILSYRMNKGVEIAPERRMGEEKDVTLLTMVKKSHILHLHQATGGHKLLSAKQESS